MTIPEMSAAAREAFPFPGDGSKTLEEVRLLRTGFDAALAQRTVTNRETVADAEVEAVWGVLNAHGIAARIKTYGRLERDVVRDALEAARAALPPTGLVAGREAIEHAKRPITFEEMAEHNNSIDELLVARIDALTIADRSDVEAGALEAAADALPQDHYYATTKFPVWLRSRATRLRSGKAE